MEGKLLRKLIAFVLILCLTATNFIFAAVNTVYAISASSELEGGNIVFEAYFKQDETKVIDKTAYVSEGADLYINLAIKAGKLQNASIKIDNANFKIEKDKVDSKYVKGINTDTNEILLNEIGYSDGQAGSVEIKLPVKFEEAQRIDLSYFSMENSITLSGHYINSSENGKDIKSDPIKTRLTWSESSISYNWVPTVEKIVSADNKTIVQVSINSILDKLYLPKESETVTINVPKVGNVTPSYTVLVNGEKLDISKINDDFANQKISFTNNFVDGNSILWDKSGDTYKVIYVYDNTDYLEKPLEFKTQVTTKVYNRESKTSNEMNMASNKPQGTIASVTATSLSNEVYKGYMYANSAETLYTEKYDLELSYPDTVATFKFAEDNFTTESQERKITNGKTVYKELKINKANLVNVLGTTGSLKIVDKNIIVNSNTQADKDGNIVIKTDDAHILNLDLISAENEGTIKIFATKAIQGNAGYDKETLKSINAIETTVKASTDLDQEVSTATARTELKETTTEATLVMNNNNILSTTTANDIEFLATLKTGTMDTDLLKAPTLKLILPEDVDQVTIKSVSALYAEEKLNVADQQVVEEEGRKVILVKLDGEQLSYDNKFIEGIKVTINTEITLKEGTTSKDDVITMKYTNENSTEKEFETPIKVSIQAPYGLMTTATANAEFEGKTADETISAQAINNYGKVIENLSFIGNMPTVEKSKEDFENSIKDSFKATIGETVVDANSITIKYSKDGKEWTDDIEDAKQYKIVLGENTKLNATEKFEVAYTIEVSQVITGHKIAYTLDGMEKVDELKEKVTVKGLEIPDSEPDPDPTPVEPVVNEDGLSVTMTATSANKTITKDDELTAGQVIRYSYVIKNTSENTIENVKFEAEHTNTNVFEYKTDKQTNTIKPDEEISFTFEKEADGKSTVEKQIGTLEAGKEIKLTYQARVKENANKVESTVVVTGKDVEEIKIESANDVKSAALKLTLSNNISNEEGIEAGKVFANTLSVKNTSNGKLENITVNMAIPEGFEVFEIYEIGNSKNFTIIRKDNTAVTFNINELAAGATKDMVVSLKTVETSKTTKALKYSATVNQQTYYSNEVKVGIREKVESKIEATQTANIDEEVVETGDKLNYTFKIKNTSECKDTITFKDTVPKGAVIKNVYYTKNDEQVKIEKVTNNMILAVIEIEPGEEIDLVVETEIDESKTGSEEITNYATISGELLPQEVKTSSITYKLKNNIKPVKPNDPDDPDDPDVPTIPGEKDSKFTISGTAWIDANKDGIRDEKEKVLPGIKVSLANTEEGFVKDSKGNKIESVTDAKGQYKFTEIPKGKYIVVFAYDNVKYRNTEYRAKAATEKTNSDIITSKIAQEDGIKYGLTDTLEISKESLENIDAGFIENEIFDLSLNKSITKVTVQNSTGTQVKQYNKEQLAKLEIDSKTLAGSTVLVEYTIEVKNEGEIAGYANELVDYMPRDLTFNSEINKDWYKSTDGNLHSTALSKELIEPGQTVAVTLTLVKTMTEANTGLTSNKAEIAKSSNDYLIPDKDSKAGNTAQGEDDMSTAELIVSIRTGVGYTIGVITTMVVIATAGTIVFIKKRKEASHE
ncbi:MAG: hypothetical protein J6I85_08460 [Clostridia bacterium]|nr:hypothetical protein [Clostridia bacterium]